MGNDVFSADDSDKLSVIEYRDTSERFVHKALTYIGEVVIQAKRNNIFSHNITDFFCIHCIADYVGEDMVSNAQDILFRDKTDKRHIVIDHGQPGNLVLSQNVDGLNNGGVLFDGYETGLHDVFGFEHPFPFHSHAAKVVNLPFQFDIARSRQSC